LNRINGSSKRQLLDFGESVFFSVRIFSYSLGNPIEKFGKRRREAVVAVRQTDLNNPLRSP